MPFLDPAECTLLLINVSPELPPQLPAPLSNLSNCYRLIRTAALTATVPLYVALREDRASGKRQSPHATPDAHYTYPLGMIRDLWTEQKLAQAIAQHKRSSLILAGSWLETDITFLALSALADGYDTYVLFDASPSHDPSTRQLAIDRILQAGAVPLSTAQMIHEWAERPSDGTRRQALLDLLGPTVMARTEAVP